jgi:hypothetical protein
MIGLGRSATTVVEQCQTTLYPHGNVFNGLSPESTLLPIREIYRSANVPMAGFSAESMLKILRSLDRRDVEVVTGFVNACFAVVFEERCTLLPTSAEKVVADAVLKIIALCDYAIPLHTRIGRELTGEQTEYFDALYREYTNHRGVIEFFANPGHTANASRAAAGGD